MGRKVSKSFYDWCVENNHENWLNLWDYDLNNCNPKEISYSNPKKYYFKCERCIHGSRLKTIAQITSNNKLPVCDKCNSIGQYLIDKYGEKALELYWDYDKNEINPFDIPKCSKKKVWVKCQEKDYHIYDVSCYNLHNGRKCPYCNTFASHRVHKKDSFGQMVIDNFGEDILNKLWCWDKNKKSPFEVSPKTDTEKFWFNCLEKDYHGSYMSLPIQFMNGVRCPYCTNHHGMVHTKDSFGQYHINSIGSNFIKNYWSDKNIINPFEISPNYTGKIWIKCKNGYNHEDYEITANNFTQGKRCPMCKESYGERYIREYLENNNIKYEYQKKFNKLKGTGNQLLSYDFYLQNYNLLIEYQGKQHENPVDIFGGEKQFKIQQEHDKRKREYAKEHDINLLEIWYWDYNNIEKILNENIK